MDFDQYQKEMIDFFKLRNWYEYNTFIRTNFLTEEVGELCQILRKIEIGRDRPDEKMTSDEENQLHLTEEIGDVLNNLIVIADKYNIDFSSIFEHNTQKLKGRFSEDELS